MNTQKFYISVNGKQLWDFIDGIDDYYALSGEGWTVELNPGSYVAECIVENQE